MPRPSMLANRKTVGIRLIHLVGIVAALMTAAESTVGAYPVDPNWSPPSTVYIPETGHTIDGLFLDLWRTGGGALSFGNPITAEMTESDGQIVQYYQYARFEYWPQGDDDGNYVALGKIGRELGPPMLVRRYSARGAANPLGDMAAARAWQPISALDATLMGTREASYRYVSGTRHGVWGGFRAFWEATGEAAYLGNPLSEEYIANSVSYQIFERGQLR